MPFALAVALDPDSAAVVWAAWRELAAAGFPFMAESGAAPHVSLAIWDEIDAAAMSAAVADWSRDTAELAIVFERVAVFPTTGVVFLAPAADPALRDMQRRCHGQLAAHGRRPWPHYAPDVWVPHCTLAQDLDGPLARARAIAERVPLPVAGRLSRAELIRFHPVQHLSTVPLVRQATVSGPSPAPCRAPR
jgi:2'-5' RNA ligase